ncbi:MAG: hypothetical protein CMN44_09640 [SAR116 cluster bacterium]|nr:hypothetical protein [SAR116 cluster bacterium]RPH08216.1 MAG: YHYH protein [Alphaproteobacteria bacterium TMED54]
MHFEIHYLKNQKLFGWSLKECLRHSGPLGRYDATYNEDYHYMGRTNKLDECNGVMYKDKYVYFITNTYPIVLRCLYGRVSSDFNKSRH